MPRIPQAYRRNVAVIVLDSQGRILACNRSDQKSAWQLPQGGIDEGESVEDALMRELEEEIGTCDITIISKLPEVLRYEWPEKLYKRGYRGQEQTYFLVRIGPHAVIDLDAHDQKEFSAFEWVGAAEFVTRLSGFKAETYLRALAEFKKLHPG